MPQFESNKEKNEDLQDTIKIMSTNLEVINQKLALYSPSQGSNAPANTENLQQLNSKINNLANIVKSGMDSINQQISYTHNKFEEISQRIRQTEQNLMNQAPGKPAKAPQSYPLIKQEMDKIRKEIQTIKPTSSGVSPTVTKDIGYIKEQLGTKFDETLRLLWRLLEINYKLLEDKKNKK